MPKGRQIREMDGKRELDKKDLPIMILFLKECFFFLSEIVSQVQLKAIPPFRPVIYTEERNILPETVSLIEQCWNDNKSDRPTFVAIEDYIRKHVQSGRFVTSTRYR